MVKIKMADIKDAEYGMGGDATLGGMARYVAVAPQDASTSVRNLDFGL